MNEVPKQVFREYDIRGVAGSEISETFAYQLAQAYVKLAGNNFDAPVVVGRDVRLSGEKLQKALVQGLLDAGIDVLDLGVIPTPLAYFAVFKHKAAGCIVVTASHNPSEFNGFKLMLGQESFQGEMIQQLYRMMCKEAVAVTGKNGKLSPFSVVNDYNRFVISDCQLKRPLKVVIDAGNGPSGLIAAPIYRALGCEVVELFCEPDGRFPNHHPDPTVAENLTSLAETVREEQADIGIAFDGDGDRIGVVDEQGQIIWGDMLLLLLSRQLLKQTPGATIISEVKSSKLLYDEIRQLGGNGVMWRTGHSPMKQKMKETGALLAGEMSGHFFFADRYYGFDDAVYAGARVIQLLAEGEQPLSTFLQDVPTLVDTPEIRIACSDERKFQIVEQAISHFSNLGYTLLTIDGMRLETDYGWALLRASNTQPGLVLRFEADTEENLLVLKNLIESWLEPEL